jgi:hypothetical protein
MDYRSMFDSKYVGAWDLIKGDVTVTIARVEGAEITGEGGKKDKKPVIHFSDASKPMIANKTNCKVIAAMYGTDCDAWAGKRLTLYKTTTEVGGETKDCIRVRPGVPK